jgi:hypothetical protein
MACSHGINATPGWRRHSFAVPLPIARGKFEEPWRNGQRARLSLGRLRVQVPSASCGSNGSSSSPVERLGEDQRAASSILARAIHAAVAECIRATLRTSWATCPWGFKSLRRYSMQGSSAAERRPHKPRQRGFDSHPCNRAPVAQVKSTRLVSGRASARDRPGAPSVRCVAHSAERGDVAPEETVRARPT